MSRSVVRLQDAGVSYVTTIQVLVIFKAFLGKLSLQAVSPYTIPATFFGLWAEKSKKKRRFNCFLIALFTVLASRNKSDIWDQHRMTKRRPLNVRNVD